MGNTGVPQPIPAAATPFCFAPSPHNPVASLAQETSAPSSSPRERGEGKGREAEEIDSLAQSEREGERKRERERARDGYVKVLVAAGILVYGNAILVGGERGMLREGGRLSVHVLF